MEEQYQYEHLAPINEPTIADVEPFQISLPRKIIKQTIDGVNTTGLTYILNTGVQQLTQYFFNWLPPKTIGVFDITGMATMVNTLLGRLLLNTALNTKETSIRIIAQELFVPYLSTVRVMYNRTFPGNEPLMDVYGTWLDAKTIKARTGINDKEVQEMLGEIKYPKAYNVIFKLANGLLTVAFAGAAAYTFTFFVPLPDNPFAIELIKSVVGFISGRLVEEVVNCSKTQIEYTCWQWYRYRPTDISQQPLIIHEEAPSPYVPAQEEPEGKAEQSEEKGEEQEKEDPQNQATL